MNDAVTPQDKIAKTSKPTCNARLPVAFVNNTPTPQTGTDIQATANESQKDFGFLVKKFILNIRISLSLHFWFKQRLGR